MRTVIAFALFGCLLGSSLMARLLNRRGSGNAVLSVCEVLEHTDRYNGKIITVRGIAEGTDEGSWLVSERCAGITTKGFRWPPSIALVAPGSPQVVHPNAVEQADATAVKRQLQALGYDARKHKLTLTYTGLFETWDDLSEHVGVDASGRARGFGFGHLSQSPAQLVVKSYRDPTLSSRNRAEAKRH